MCRGLLVCLEVVCCVVTAADRSCNVSSAFAGAVACIVYRNVDAFRIEAVFHGTNCHNYMVTVDGNITVVSGVDSTNGFAAVFDCADFGVDILFYVMSFEVFHDDREDGGGFAGSVQGVLRSARESIKKAHDSQKGFILTSGCQMPALTQAASPCSFWLIPIAE